MQTGEYGIAGKAHRVDFLIDENQSITIGFNSYDDTFLFMKNVAEISGYHENLIENGISLEQEKLMKNKKIIPLTIAVVAVALIATLGLSKVFETGWQNENN